MSLVYLLVLCVRACMCVCVRVCVLMALLGKRFIVKWSSFYLFIVNSASRKAESDLIECA